MQQPLFRRDNVILLTLIPIELLIGVFVPLLLKHQPIIISIIGFLVALIIFGITITLRQSLLREDWHRWRDHPWRNLLFVGITVLAFWGIQEVANRLLPGTIQLQSLSGGDKAAVLLGFFVPLMAPFTEEIIFRYELFYRFMRAGRWVATAMAVLSSMLFGLSHFISGDPLPSLVTLAVTGLALSAIYAWTHNIWVTLIGHFIWNLTLALPTLMVLFLGLPA